MAYLFTQDEKTLSGFPARAGIIDAPAYSNNTYVLAEGVSGYGALPSSSSYPFNDVDVYSLGYLNEGTYEIEVQRNTWDFFDSTSYASPTQFSLFRNGIKDFSSVNYLGVGSIEFEVGPFDTSADYAVEITGPMFGSSQYSVTYEKTAEPFLVNIPASFFNPIYDGTLQPNSIVSADLTYVDQNGVSPGSQVIGWWLRSEAGVVELADLGTSSQYQISESDTGKTLLFSVGFTDNGGFWEESQQFEIGLIEPLSVINYPASFSNPSSDGVLQPDSVVTANVTAADQNGVSSSSVVFSWWLRSESGVLELATSGVSNQYRPNESDIGKSLLFSVGFTDNAGFLEESQRFEIGSVQPIPELPELRIELGDGFDGSIVNAGDTVTFRIEFVNAVEGLDIGDLSASEGTLRNLTRISESIYQVSLIISEDTQATDGEFSIDNTGIQHESGLSGEGSTQIEFDITPLPPVIIPVIPVVPESGVAIPTDSSLLDPEISDVADAASNSTADPMASETGIVLDDQIKSALENFDKKAIRELWEDSGEDVETAVKILTENKVGSSIDDDVFLEDLAEVVIGDDELREMVGIESPETVSNEMVDTPDVSEIILVDPLTNANDVVDEVILEATGTVSSEANLFDEDLLVRLEAGDPEAVRHVWDFSGADALSARNHLVASRGEAFATKIAEMVIASPELMASIGLEVNEPDDLEPQMSDSVLLPEPDVVVDPFLANDTLIQLDESDPYFALASGDLEAIIQFWVSVDGDSDAAHQALVDAHGLGFAMSVIGGITSNDNLMSELTSDARVIAIGAPSTSNDNEMFSFDDDFLDKLEAVDEATVLEFWQTVGGDTLTAIDALKAAGKDDAFIEEIAGKVVANEMLSEQLGFPPPPPAPPPDLPYGMYGSPYGAAPPGWDSYDPYAQPDSVPSDYDNGYTPPPPDNVPSNYHFLDDRLIIPQVLWEDYGLSADDSISQSYQSPPPEVDVYIELDPSDPYYLPPPTTEVGSVFPSEPPPPEVDVYIELDPSDPYYLPPPPPEMGVFDPGGDVEAVPSFAEDEGFIPPPPEMGVFDPGGDVEAVPSFAEDEGFIPSPDLFYN